MTVADLFVTGVEAVEGTDVGGHDEERGERPGGIQRSAEAKTGVSSSSSSQLASEELDDEDDDDEDDEEDDDEDNDDEEK